jgi:transcriptional regulator with XRE-family HTH domain
MTSVDEQRSSDPVDLAGSLRALRQTAGMSQVEASRSASITQAKLSRIETGKALPTPTEVEALARVYEVAPERRRLMVDQAATMASQYVDSRVILQTGAHHFQQRIRETEAAAALIRSYQPALVLGVLQTSAYATAVFAGGGDLDRDGLSEQEAAKSVASRMSRWQLLAEPGRRWRLIQTEAALRWIVRSPTLMIEQLDRIAEASRLPHVELGVIPLNTVAPNPAPLHGFHIYDDESVMFGTETGTALLSGSSRVVFYTAMFAGLERLAVFGDDSRELLDRIAAEHRKR